VSPRRSRAALYRALDAGITWYDVAPSYGDGLAEKILGQCLAGRRDRVVITTKVGILPPAISPLARTIKPLVRGVIRPLPRARTLVAGWRPAPVIMRITPELVETSVGQSLRRLNTDHVDVLALHEPSLEEVSDDAVLSALERIRARGEALALAVAGDPNVVAHALKASDLFGIGQIRSSPFSREVEHLRREVSGRKPTIVTFGVFGRGEQLRRLTARLDGDPGLEGDFRAAGIPRLSSREMARAFLLDYAFAANEKGVVLASMAAAEHLQENIARAAKPVSLFVPALAARLGGTRISEFRGDVP
jgi:aryl-alcohol dehydrogenase-like predicted oxidoreductase